MSTEERKLINSLKTSLQAARNAINRILEHGFEEDNLDVASLEIENAQLELHQAEEVIDELNS